MKIVLLILLPLYLFALSPQSCYTVQLVSVAKKEKHAKSLYKESYDKSCHIFEIGKNLTVRCGCFDTYKEAKKHQKNVAQEYNKSYIATTYRSRFAKFNEKKEQTRKEVIVPLPLAKTAPQESVTLKPALKTIVAPATVTLVSATASDVLPQTLVEKTQPKEVAKKSKKKKRKKKKKSKKKKNKKKKNKKTTKTKIVKKHPKNFFYDRYIAMLKHDKMGIGKYDYRYAFGARISYDLAYVSEAERSYFDHEVRRFRVWHEGSFFHKKLFYEFEYSLTGDNNYKNVYVGYKEKFFDKKTSVRVKAGNIKIPFSLERYTSSKYNMFMERSLSDLFSISRKLGGEIVVSNKLGDYRLNLFGAYFTNSIDERQDGETNKPGLATRITLSNKLAKRNLYSVGIGVKTQDYKGDTIKMKQAAESDLVEDKYVSTKIKEVDSILDTNLEALYIYDKYTLQGEMTHRSVDAQKGNYNFYSYYLQGSYFVLGRGKDFKRSTSTIAGVKPTKDGAVELAVRYSYLNLNDKDEQGGEQQDVTFGVNWYIDDNLRVSGNYIVANPQKTDDYDGIFQVLQARILFFF